MDPHKEIVARWLQAKGFFVMQTVRAGPARSIDLIAIKQAEGAARVLHVEIHCSLTSPMLTERERTDLNNRFFHPSIVSRLEETLAQYVGKNIMCENVLVSSIEHVVLPDVVIIPFERVLLKVIEDVDRYNYRDDAMRTLQLIKHFIIRKPRLLKHLMEQPEIGQTGEGSKRRMAQEMLTMDATKSFLRSKQGEEALLSLLAESSLVSTERFGRAVLSLLSKRARAALIKDIVPAVEAAGQEEEQRSEESLDKFLS